VALTLVAALVGSGFYIFVIKPIKTFRELNEDQNSTEAELREAAHNALRWTTNHDALINLMDCGDQSSIPVLIRSMRRIPAHQVESGMIECTWDHCRDALKTITGEDFAYDADRWQAWYENS
jgi:hypothetical protein